MITADFLLGSYLTSTGICKEVELAVVVNGSAGI